MAQLFKSILPFSGMSFQDYWEKMEFSLSFCRFWETYLFFNTGIPFYWPLRAFYHFWLRYHVLIFSSTCVNIQSWLRANQRWKPNVSESRKSALIQSWFFLKQLWIFLVLNSADSKKIRADQPWNWADQRWCFSRSLSQHWKIVQSVYSVT